MSALREIVRLHIDLQKEASYFETPLSFISKLYGWIVRCSQRLDAVSGAWDVLLNPVSFILKDPIHSREWVDKSKMGVEIPLCHD